VREADVVVLASNAIFDALPPADIASICNEAMQRRSVLARSPSFGPAEEAGLPEMDEANKALLEVAERIVFAAHTRAQPVFEQARKVSDDASVVVAEVLPWELAARSWGGGAGRGARKLLDCAQGGG